MTDDDTDRLRVETHEMAKEAMESARRMEEYFFGKTGKTPSRVEMLDEMIFGFRAGKWVYRVTLGLAALFVAVGGIYATIRGWKS